MERVQRKSRAAIRIHPQRDPILGLSSQGVRLTNGRYSVSLSAVGSGASECSGMAVSRWTPDPTCNSDGFHVFLRDLEDGFVWSAGYQPTRVLPDFYDFQFSSSMAEIARMDREIECRLAVCVAPEWDFELRRCRLTNRGSRPRRIDLTSYVEFVLGSSEADANHPAFSKLFIETEFWRDQSAILARRRLRSSEEPERWGFHRLLVGDDHILGDVQFETNRAAFIGRGRSLADPRALDHHARLTGDHGPVLDPIGSLRTAVSLGPGETREVVFMLGATQGRPAIEALHTAIVDLAAANAILAAAEEADAATNGEKSRWIPHPAHDGLEARLREVESRRLFLPTSAVVTEVDRSPQWEREPLQFENGYGGFSADGREYVIRLQPDGRGGHRLPPQPWVNVISNEWAGCLVTEQGAGYTWAGNSRLNRITAWYNDPVCDPHAEAFWVRDEEARVFWSPMPGPTPAAAEYEVRHGFGYTTFRHESHGLAQEVSMFMAQHEPVKLTRLRLENLGPSVRRLSVFSYARWALGSLAEETAGSITTEYDARLLAILARNPLREPARKSVAFSAVMASKTIDARSFSYSGDRTAFLGQHGDLDAPVAVVADAQLDNRTGRGLDPCAVWQLPIEIPPGGAFECTFVLGEAASRDGAADLIGKYRQPGEVQRALEQITDFWHQTLSAVQIETPNPEIDLLVNGWLPYQDLSCRMWGRSAYYQPGGAYGFRDQLQDAAALVYHRPDLTREQILRHARQQFLEGDVLHWWHPETGYGLRTRFSDDLLWLPYVTAAYVETTGDNGVLDEMTPFIMGPRIGSDRDELYLRGEEASESASVYEHCCRAIDRGLTTGVHGLPLIGSGDWNDGMNRVGREGQGESVWLGFFIHSVLERMLPICRSRDDLQRIERYAACRDRLAVALNRDGWDGAWYRRAFYDDGAPLGSAASDECQIDALAQAWAVLSGVAPHERAAMAMRAVDERLVVADAGIIRLLAPPFDRTPRDPGYIKGYLPGVRENGGQYTHGVLWVVRAMAEMGRGTRAVELLRMLSPIAHTRTAEQVAIYQTEPYVVAADVYGEPPHVGRGGWTWYTGSAGWMFRVAVESILGLSLVRGRTLVIKPAISSAWPRCRLSYRLPGEETCYEITIENPNGKETGVAAATLDGQLAGVEDGAARIPLQHDGKCHAIVVRL